MFSNQFYLLWYKPKILAFIFIYLDLLNICIKSFKLKINMIFINRFLVKTIFHFHILIILIESQQESRIAYKRFERTCWKLVIMIYFLFNLLNQASSSKWNKNVSSSTVIYIHQDSFDGYAYSRAQNIISGPISKSL